MKKFIESDWLGVMQLLVNSAKRRKYSMPKQGNKINANISENWVLWLVDKKYIRTNQLPHSSLVPLRLCVRLGWFVLNCTLGQTVLETNFDPVTVKFFMNTVLIQGNFVQFQAYLPVFVCFSKSSNMKGECNYYIHPSGWCNFDTFWKTHLCADKFKIELEVIWLPTLM